jgi:translation initiation factor IF-3
VCDFGKYKYEESKKKKENKKSALTNKVKEVQLRPRCEKHDFDFKLTRAIDFLCADMKVKIYLRFRGRENAHKEFGFDAVKRFVKELLPFGKTDTAPRLVGRGITILVNPLPAKQRAENPHRKHGEEIPMEDEIHYDDDEETGNEKPTGDTLNNAFESLEVNDEKQAET